MHVPIELETSKDVENFTKICQSVDVDVRLTGKDENGHHWELSAKSLFCSLLLSARMQHKSTAQNVDWNTLWCDCEKDIYELISEYVKSEE